MKKDMSAIAEDAGGSLISLLRNNRALGSRVSVEQARSIGDELGVNWSEVDIGQFRRGLEVEQEHGSRDSDTNVTHDDPKTTGEIVLAHLREVPDYYTRLDKVEQKYNGVPVEKKYKICAQVRGKSVEIPIGHPVPFDARDFRIEDEDGIVHDNRIFPSFKEADKMLLNLKASYFGDCKRDKLGHCVPQGQPGEGKTDEGHSEKPAGSGESEKPKKGKDEENEYGIIHYDGEGRISGFTPKKPK